MKTKLTAAPCVVSVAEHAGWAHVICVAAAGNAPTVIERRRVTLIDAGLPTLPYHHDTIGMREDEANALIARVQRSIASCTARELRRVIADLAPTHAAIALAIRDPVFRELPESVATVRQSYRLQCAADCVMYQLALCRAARDLGLEVHACRRGQEIAGAAERLGVTTAAIESFISRIGRPDGPPWTEEHRRAFAAGIATLVQLNRRVEDHEKLFLKTSF
jgi:hypothetical protein